MHLLYAHFVQCVQSLLSGKECWFSLLEISFTVNLFCCDGHVDLVNLDLLHLSLSLLLCTLLSFHPNHVDQMVRLCILLCQLHLGENIIEHSAEKSRGSQLNEMDMYF